MLKQIYKKNLCINYNSEGKGPVIFLIHGFLETSEIWSTFSKELSKYFRVISIDLPGHGKSDLFNAPYLIEKYAESVYSVLSEEKIKKVFLIGHSMGGYAALSFAKLYPDFLNALCLFHSTPFSDNEEKKTARLNTVKLIQTGHFEEICAQHVRNVYAEENISYFKNEIERAEKIAIQINKKAVIASIHAMIGRNDTNETLKKLEVPFLFIAGSKDKFISVEVVNRIMMPEKHETKILNHSGHMGMIEEQLKSLEIIKDFTDRYISIIQ
jgi:pimeloyl-ACP methyl ester carboxylesterase